MPHPAITSPARAGMAEGPGTHAARIVPSGGRLPEIPFEDWEPTKVTLHLWAQLIGKIKLDPTKKAELQAVVEAHAHELALREAELQMKLADFQAREIEAAGANIRAEAQSGDKFTSRARPSFLYVMLAIFVCNYIAFPLMSRPPLEFPEPLFWLFGSCMLGYTGARTWEKFSVFKNGNGNGNGNGAKK